MLSSAISRVVDGILREPLTAASGGIGFVGADLPVELLVATGRPFGHLPWRAEGTTAWADRWLESGFPGWTRSILEDWHEGRFDDLAQVVFSRADDASQRLYYYIRELQQRGQIAGPAALVFDIALLPRESSLAHTGQSLRSLGETLGAGDAALSGAMPQVNALRCRLAQWQGDRSSDGPAYERLARATLFSDATRWIGLDAGLASASTTIGVAPRVLLAGSVPPDERLHHAVEESGACVVGEAHAHGLLRLGAPLEPTGESPWLALARHLRAASAAPRSVFDRAQWLVSQALQARASGVVLWLTREEESLAWHVPAQRAALQAAGIPCLSLTARRWSADDGALSEISEFCREIHP
jgi:2-hydroxyglutaryl-CoA dehydratase, D-component